MVFQLMLESSFSNVEVSILLTVFRRELVTSGPVKGLHINSGHIRGRQPPSIAIVALIGSMCPLIELSKLPQWDTLRPV